MNKDEVLLVLTNLPDHDSALRIANSLIEHHVAACVNILSACNSVYHWQGKIETSTEVPLMIKTTRAAYFQVEKLILSQHPYELPEIIAVSATAGLPAYLQWVSKEILLTH